ncbi:MAG: NAD(P)H-hydrate epimerase [Planctomycetota bacterium]
MSRGSPRGFPRERCRDLDRIAIEELGIPGLILMEHASIGASLLAVDMLEAERPAGAPGAEVLVLCGPGNNGGDGYAIARHLANAGCLAEVWDLIPPARIDPEGDAGRNRSILLAMGISPRPAHEGPPEVRSDIDLIVDGIFGTGLTRAPEGLFATCIEQINRSAAPILAVDIPSGLDADRGVPLGDAVEASSTATFGLIKQGFLARGARRFTGEVFCVPIGIPGSLLPPGTPAFPPAPVAPAAGGPPRGHTSC